MFHTRTAKSVECSAETCLMGRITLDAGRSENVFEFDVALSYASEDRIYVQSVATQLRSRGVRVFYDEFSTAEMWGADLYVLFDDIFRRRARFAILFVSHHYVTKPWPQHERQSAQARALVESDPYILPVRLDSSEVPGLRPTVSYIDAQHVTSEGLVDLILQKIGQTRSSAASTPPAAITSVPRTPEETRELLGRRPDGWEHLFFAGLLVQGKDRLEGKWRDHELRYVRPTGPLLTDTEAVSFVRAALSDLLVYAQNVERVFNDRTQEAAFGPRGVTGDVRQIEHLGERLIAVYEDLLDWAARVRGARPPARLRRLFELHATSADRTIVKFREFIDRYAEAASERLMLAGQTDPIVVDITFPLGPDSEVQAAIDREYKRLGLDVT